MSSTRRFKIRISPMKMVGIPDGATVKLFSENGEISISVLTEDGLVERSLNVEEILEEL